MILRMRNDLWARASRSEHIRKATMEEEQKEVGPTIGEYQGKPILRIPTVEKPNPDTSWHWLSFGKNKAKAIVKYFDAIKKFAEE